MKENSVAVNELIISRTIQRVIPILCGAIFLSLCLTPFIPVTGNLYFRIDDFLLPLAVLCVLPVWKSARLWYFGVLIFWGLYMLLTMGINGRMGAYNDYTEIYKLFKYGVFALLFYQYFRSGNDFFKAVSTVFIVLVVFNVFHFYNLMHFNTEVMPEFVTNIDQLKFFGRNSLGFPATKRLLGTMGNPNINGTLFALFTIYFMSFLNLRKWHWGKLFFYVGLGMLLLTQSRTNMLAIGMCIGLFMIYSKPDWRRLLTISAGIVITIGAVKLADPFSLSYVSDAKMSVAENGSLRGRLEVWKELWGMIVEKPVFGYGINKNYFYEHEIYPENEYILMTWRYGFIGLILYLIFLGGLILKNWKHCWSVRNYKNLIFMQVVLLYGLNAMTNAPTSDTVLLVFFAIATGLFLSQFQLNEKIKITAAG